MGHSPPLYRIRVKYSKLEPLGSPDVPPAQSEPDNKRSINNVACTTVICNTSVAYLVFVRVSSMGAATARVARVRSRPTFGNLTWDPPKIV